ncbi:PH domain-containing protein [Clostridium sp. AM58-1XD]|uniref:PH domain-containing protein n=1 Tax=Clostridium sp. AM58-1XD TaxID=2292307 RepID=UPI000E48B5B6|nr:PH domain-containing protein [Clostridium sp. AM58-1XD]RGZ01850.1 PH domain-containing protein [Clostridium sp. AM58-1XD]
MADTLELREGESVEKEIKGDYWEKSFCFYSQKTGKYWFTNERIIFRGGFIAAVDIPYTDIESVKACNVGPLIPFLPTGVKVSTKDGKTYKLSVLKRKEIIAFIESKM